MTLIHELRSQAGGILVGFHSCLPTVIKFQKVLCEFPLLAFPIKSNQIAQCTFSLGDGLVMAIGRPVKFPGAWRKNKIQSKF